MTITKTCYIYIPVPRHRRLNTPTNARHHITILYVGKTTESQYDEICQSLAERVSWSPISMLIGLVGLSSEVRYFEEPAGRIAYVPIRDGGADLCEMHREADALVRKIQGLESYRSRIDVYPEYTPHMTLARLSAGETYTGQWGPDDQTVFYSNDLWIDWGSARRTRVIHGSIYDEDPSPRFSTTEASLELIRRMVLNEPPNPEVPLELPDRVVPEDVVVAVSERLTTLEDLVEKA